VLLLNIEYLQVAQAPYKCVANSILIKKEAAKNFFFSNKKMKLISALALAVQGSHMTDGIIRSELEIELTADSPVAYWSVPLVDGLYERGQVMRVLASVSNMDGYNIKVEFTRFDVPIEDDTVSKSCPKDTVSVFDSRDNYPSTHLGTFCGKDLPTSVSAVGKYLLLVFDARLNKNTGTGFEAKFTLEPKPEIIKKWQELVNARNKIAKTIPIHLLPDWRIKEESIFVCFYNRLLIFLFLR